MNYVSALAILIAFAANFAHMRSQSGGGEPLNPVWLGAHALFYANAVLAIWHWPIAQQHPCGEDGTVFVTIKGRDGRRAASCASPESSPVGAGSWGVRSSGLERSVPVDETTNVIVSGVERIGVHDWR